LARNNCYPISPTTFTPTHHLLDFLLRTLSMTLHSKGLQTREKHI
jgi:hypothetical protein